MTDQRRDLLIDKYHHGTINQAELGELNEWLTPHDPLTVQLTEPEEYIRESIRHSVYQKIAAREPRRRPFRKYRGLAATILVLTLAGYGAFRFRDQVRNFIDPVVLTEQVAGVGSIVTVTLHDGTRVWLNAGSSLRYPKKFNRSVREVTLQGEGYFEVAHNPHKPFIVHTGPLEVQVLGTSFNVQNYGNEPAVEVTLLTGKVALRSPGESWVSTIAPGQQARYNKERSTLATEDVAAPGRYTHWTTGELSFTEAPLRDILHSLERRYGVHFKVQGIDTGECRFTTSFKRISLHEALTIVGMITNTEFTIRGNEIIMKGNGCTLKHP